MAKAFLFDWGGVMSAGGKGGELAQRLASNLHISDATAWDALKDVWEQYMRGTISEPALWSHVENLLQRNIATQERNIWNAWDQTSLLPKMGRLVTQLKGWGYPVGLLSNTIPNTMQEIRTHGGYELFDFTILSCEVGYAKPDPEIYTLALRALTDVSPSEVVFIDDQQRCLDGATRIGMHTILAVTPDQVMSDVLHIVDSQKSV